MAAIRTLVMKELSQHGTALGGITVLLAIAWGLASAIDAQQARVLSALDRVSTFAMLPLLTVTLYLGHRLVVVEYFGRTQRFVEALPVRRGQMAVVKAVFGLVWLELWAAGALLAGVVAASSSEPVDGRFLGILAARLGLYVFAVWGVVFLLGFCGRLRIPLAMALLMLLLLLDQNTAWEMQRFGPWALVARESFAFERHHYPTTALLQSAAVGVIAIAMAWVLLRIREGSIVESLARRLSARELTAILVLAGAALTAFSVFDREADPEPYAFSTNKVVRVSDGRVEVAYLDDDLQPAAERLLAELGPTLKAFAAALELPWPLVPVRLVHGPEISADRPRVIRSHIEQGLVLRVNLAEGTPRARNRIISVVLREWVLLRTGGRAGIEPKRWLLDGFALYFTLHGRAVPPAAHVESDQALLQALVAAELVPLAAQPLNDYLMTAERLGEDLSEALCASGWRVLETRVGRPKAWALARAAFTRFGTGDVRDFVHERRNPLPVLFERATGVNWGKFLTAWVGTLEEWRREAVKEAAIVGLPRGKFAVRAEAGKGVGVEAELDAPLVAATPCTLRHCRLLPYDTVVSPDDLEEVGFVWSGGASHLDRFVKGIYGRGERAFVALDCQIAALGGQVRLAVARVTVP